MEINKVGDNIGQLWISILRAPKQFLPTRVLLPWQPAPGKQEACAIGPRETQAKKKMGSSKEMLRSDIRTIHGALEEVLNCARPDVPSWRFPGRLSASLSLEDVLGPSEEQERASLLEGIVDRLLLLLQASLKLWTEAEERRPSHPLPLSLSSAVRKFCRQLLQTRRKTQLLQTQVDLSVPTQHHDEHSW